MAKGGKKRIRAGTAAWSASDHAIHSEQLRQRRLKRSSESGEVSQRELRRQANTHGTTEKKDTLKLQLHLSKTKRALEILKERLEDWDPLEEKEREEQEEAKKKMEREEEELPEKKKGRKGPETWKLKGAARPAWEVYDFDTRYVDPQQEAHKKAAARVQRSQNILAIYKGRLAQDGPKVARDYLSLLMQLGHLNQESKQFKTARSAWLECIELEGEEPITTARESLMRMYLDLKRNEAALRLGERFAEDPSVWVRYSTALVALAEKSNDAEKHLLSAIRSNPFCAYYLAFYDVFVDVYEYTDALEDADEGPQSLLEEAIEYASSGQGSRWKGEPSAALRKIVVDAIRGKHSELTAKDLEWKVRLALIEQDFLSRNAPDASKNFSSSDGEEQDAGNESQAFQVDFTMYIGMFRTAMDMVQEEGHI